MREIRGEKSPLFCETDTITDICSLDEYVLLLSFRSFVHGNFVNVL